MSFVVTVADRTSFKRCRRQWDFQAGNRQDLEPLQPPALPDLDRALRDALAVYYYPGMWDWDRGVRLPLVRQGLDRAMARQQERCGDSAECRLVAGAARGEPGPAGPLFRVGAHGGPVLAGADRSGLRGERARSGLAEEGRLGGGAWGMGRGAAPPRFRGSPSG